MDVIYNIAVMILMSLKTFIKLLDQKEMFDQNQTFTNIFSNKYVGL